jgi:hypothetical protein
VALGAGDEVAGPLSIRARWAQAAAVRSPAAACCHSPVPFTCASCTVLTRRSRDETFKIDRAQSGRQSCTIGNKSQTPFFLEAVTAASRADDELFAILDDPSTSIVHVAGAIGMASSSRRALRLAVPRSTDGTLVRSNVRSVNRELREAPRELPCSSSCRPPLAIWCGFTGNAATCKRTIVR